MIHFDRINDICILFLYTNYWTQIKDMKAFCRNLLLNVKQCKLWMVMEENVLMSWISKDKITVLK